MENYLCHFLDLVDKEKELERLGKEKKKLEGEVTRIEKKLSNAGFVAKAPEAVIDVKKKKLVKYQEMLDAVLVRIDTLNLKVNFASDKSRKICQSFIFK